MALTANTIWEVESGGSDTANGGAFDPSQTAGMFTDGAATSATGNSPVFTSASYNFVAGDVGAWVFIASGTNWTPGWYKIASVASNAATLSAAIGAAVLVSSNIPSGPTTAAGCATTASPTGATWTIDYSQQSAAQFTYTDLASTGAGLTVSSAAFPFAKQQVGNSIVITGGTNFTTGRYIIASVAAGVATVVGAGNITTGVGASGTGGQGGALASPGQAGAAFVASNKLFIKQATYTVTSASSNVANGCFSATSGTSLAQGYTTVRGDSSTRPTIIAGSSISSFTLITNTGAGSLTKSLITDGNSYTTSRGISAGSAENCKAQNCTNRGLSTTSGSGATFFNCETTGCATTAPAMYNASGACVACYSHDNTVTGFWTSVAVDCVASNNTGAGSRGFDDGFTINPGTYLNCSAYANGGDGFRHTNTSGPLYLANCISYLNGGYGFNGIAQTAGVKNCAFLTNTSGDINSVSSAFVSGKITLSADPFTNKAGNDYSLNNTAGGGAACRAAGFPGAFTGGTTTGYLDIGAVQHSDPAKPDAVFINPGWNL